MSWTELLAVAQQALNFYQRAASIRRTSEMYEEELSLPLIAAARIIHDLAFHSVADKSPEIIADKILDESEKDTSERIRLMILASCAFAMYGNFPSSAAVQERIDLNLVKSEAELICLAISNPSKIGSFLFLSSFRPASREFLERLNMFLYTGDESEDSQIMRQFEELISNSPSVSDVVYYRCARLALSHVITLSIAKLRYVQDFPVYNNYIRGLLNNGRKCLLPPQKTLIDSDLISSEQNGIITIPTSTGKTLLAELIMAGSIRSKGDIAIYVAPYIALGRQVYQTIQNNAPRDVQVRGYFGSFNSDIEPLVPNRSAIIVATPERLDAILRSYPMYDRIRSIVFDEAHGIENGDRGSRIESLITRMLLQQRQGRRSRIILLSAVLSQTEKLREWLGNDADHFQDSWRPTARRLAIWASEGLLIWLYGNDPLRPQTARAVSILGRKVLNWPDHMRPASAYGAIAAQLPAAFRNVAYLSDYIKSSIGGPVLIACGTKRSTRGVATAVAQRLEVIDQANSAREAITDLIERDFVHLRPLAEMVKRGVAYHNASLPSAVRILIEDAVKTRAIMFVAATTTLAEGVDLPFRVTIIFDWLMGFKEQQAPMSALLFRNIAGRCGRAGEFTEGDTIIFDNMLGPPQYTDASIRRSAQVTVFSDPAPLSSAIANDNVPADVKGAVRAVISSQLLASIPENPGDDALEITFAENLYAARLGRAPVEMLESIRSELLSDANGAPFAEAASPMRLTKLGEAANRSGFSPKTCRLMLDLMPTLDRKLEAPRLAELMLIALGDVDEQTNYILKEIVSTKTTRSYAKASDLSFMALGWLEGRPLIDIFVDLPKARSSKAAVRPSEWAKGEKEADYVSSQYDQFVDVMEFSFGSFVPWVLRAMSTLSGVSEVGGRDDWAELAKTFEGCRNADEGAVEASSFAQVLV